MKFIFLNLISVKICLDLLHPGLEVLLKTLKAAFRCKESQRVLEIKGCGWVEREGWECGSIFENGHLEAFDGESLRGVIFQEDPFHPHSLSDSQRADYEVQKKGFDTRRINQLAN